MFLSKILIHLCMVIHYMVEGNIFAGIVCKLSAQKKYQNFILKIALKLMVNKGLRFLKKVNTLTSKILKEKLSYHLWFMPILKALYHRKIMQGIILNGFTRPSNTYKDTTSYTYLKLGKDA